MRVITIDLQYSGSNKELLDQVVLHVSRKTLTGNDVFQEVALTVEEVRALEKVLNSSLRRLTRGALESI